MNLMTMLGIFVSVSFCISLCMFTLSNALCMFKVTTIVCYGGLGFLKPLVVWWQMLCKAVCVLSIYEVHSISFQTFLVWTLLLTVHTKNSSPLQSILLRHQCTCCTVPTTSGKPPGSLLV